MNEERMLIVGNRLKLIRAEAKMKQKDFAAQFGIATTTYSGYESGRHEPTIDFLIKIADKYELSLDYVVGRSVHKEGLIEDDFNNFMNENIIEPFKEEGKTEVEMMEAVYTNFQKSLDYVTNQMADLRKMIDDKKAEKK